MKKRLRSFKYAGQGIRSVIGSEPNMRIHIVFASLVIICGFLFSLSLAEWLLCMLCIGFVMAAEMFNTAIEGLVNLVSPGQNPLAGKIKDIAAGAVLVASIISALIGLLIFVPKGWAFLLTFM